MFVNYIYSSQKYSLKLLPAALLGVAWISGIPTVQAEKYTIEEVVVTAQRREENLQDVPLSVAAFSSETLKKSGINGTKDLPVLSPSLQLVTSGPSATFFVRGVGNSSSGTGEEGTNAFYVDGVFMPSLKQTAMKFNNIERIEILKGPQGTLFGRNSSGGLVNVMTKEPGDTFTGDINVGVANYETTNAQLYVAGPLSDTLSADFALTSTDQNEGWGEDQQSGKDVSLGWDWGARTKWVWRPNDMTKISFAGDYSKSSDNYSVAYRLAPDSLGLNPALFGLTGFPGSPTYPPSDPFDTDSDQSQYSDLTTWGLNLTAEFDVGWATLTSITGSRKGTNDSYFDADMTPYNLLNIRVEDNEESIQEELRLASNGDGPLSWQGGLFYLQIEANLDPQTLSGLSLAGSGGDNATYSTLNTKSYAVFGEVTYDLTEATHITVGARYTQDKLDFDGALDLLEPGLTVSTVDENVTEREPTYRFALRHEFNSNVNVYASYNRGYKSGTFSMSAINQAPVEPQTIDAYEIGMKSDLWDSRLRLNLSVFHYEISDYQVRSASGANPVPVLLNAAEVEVDGLEVDFEIAATENLRVFGSLSWLHSEFGDFPYAPFTSVNDQPVPALGGLIPGGTSTVIADASGNNTPLAPEFSGNLGVNYHLPLADLGEVDFSLLYSYNSGYYFESDNRLEQPSFGLLNASASYYPSPNWSVTLWGRNLTDETHYNQKLTISGLGDVGITAAPRTYGANVQYSF